MQENFLQENTGTDKIKIYNKTSSYYIYSWVLTIVVQLVSCDSFATPWTVAHQTSLSMGFPRQETGVGPCLSSGDLPDPEIKHMSLTFPTGFYC